MKLYRDAHGVIVGTQAEAKRMGKGWEPIEVPTDKQGLIDYLNASLHGPVDTSDIPEADEAFFEKATLVLPSETARRMLREGEELDQITGWIFELDGWRLARLLTATIERAAELKRGLT